MIKDQQCRDCVHYYPIVKKEGQGQCRCNPPQVIVIQGGMVEQPSIGADGNIVQVKKQTNQVQPVFPPMMASDPGCGQYRLPGGLDSDDLP